MSEKQRKGGKQVGGAYNYCTVTLINSGHTVNIQSYTELVIHTDRSIGNLTMSRIRFLYN